ncbi:hypothetical protein FRC02_011721 [Tulasnella sp. 418]|nr:hypothetical protein FRC02_011721 [Tulasnella sp. 418]
MSFESFLSVANGSHPKTVTKISASPPHSSCTLHLLFTLPPLVIFDTFEFTLQHNVYGDVDLELPVHAVGNQGSRFLLIKASNKGEFHEVEVPLHIRYPMPASGGGFENFRVDWPQVFWACNKHDVDQIEPKTLDLSSYPAPFNSPFDQRLYTMIPIPPHSTISGSYELSAPKGNLTDLSFVQQVTAMTMWASLIYILGVAYRVTQILRESRRC